MEDVFSGGFRVRDCDADEIRVTECGVIQPVPHGFLQFRPVDHVLHAIPDGLMRVFFRELQVRPTQDHALIQDQRIGEVFAISQGNRADVLRADAKRSLQACLRMGDIQVACDRSAIFLQDRVADGGQFLQAGTVLTNGALGATVHGIHLGQLLLQTIQQRLRIRLGLAMQSRAKLHEHLGIPECLQGVAIADRQILVLNNRFFVDPHAVGPGLCAFIHVDLQRVAVAEGRLGGAAQQGEMLQQRFLLGQVGGIPQVDIGLLEQVECLLDRRFLDPAPEPVLDLVEEPHPLLGLLGGIGLHDCINTGLIERLSVE